MDSVTPHVGFADNHAVDVRCPDCTMSFVVAFEVIEDCQRMLDECGYCTGLASYECPAPYFAGLATPETLSHIHALATTEDSLRIDLARWEDDGGASITMQMTHADQQVANLATFRSCARSGRARSGRRACARTEVTPA